MFNKAFFKKSVNTFCSNVRSDLKDLAESIQIKMLNLSIYIQSIFSAG